MQTLWDAVILANNPYVRLIHIDAKTHFQVPIVAQDAGVPLAKFVVHAIGKAFAVCIAIKKKINKNIICLEKKKDSQI